MINAFQDFLQIEPDVFEGLVLDGLVSNTPIQNKKKCVPRRKNITESVQVGLETMEKDRKEEVLEVQISSRGRIICNTCKMLFFKLILALYNLQNLLIKFGVNVLEISRNVVMIINYKGWYNFSEFQISGCFKYL